MNKVVCVDASKGRISGTIPPFKEGEVLTVIQDVYFTDSYKVLEYLFNEKGHFQVWQKDRFIPISEIDETEFGRNYNIEKIKL